MYPRIALGLVVAGVLCLMIGAFAALANHGFEGELTGGGQSATDAADLADNPADGQDAARRMEGGRGDSAGDASLAAEPPDVPARAVAGSAPPPEASDAQEEKTAARE